MSIFDLIKKEGWTVYKDEKKGQVSFLVKTPY